MIDHATLAEMSVPIEDRIRQIKINLERRRWQNRDLGKDNIYINLADSSVKLVHDERSVQFVTVTNVEQLRDLPTFFGRITGIEARPTDTSTIVLTVESPFIQQLGGEASAKTIAITDVEALAGDLLASHAAPGATLDDLLSSDALQENRFRRTAAAFRDLRNGVGQSRRLGPFPAGHAWPRQEAG